MRFDFKGKKGVTIIELMIVLAIIATLILAAIFVYQRQMAKARDSKRKTDLNKLQKALEDYLNDNLCYPEPAEMACGQSFAPYLHKIPCDPLNNVHYNYFYSYDGNVACKTWYKIYTKLENEDDSIIVEVGCSGGCGPSKNYNYLVSSPNVTQVAQILPAEGWWPEIPGVTPPPGVTPTATPFPTPTPTPTTPPTLTPTPTLGVSPTPTPTPTEAPCPGSWYACQGGVCNATFEGSPLEPKFCDDPCCGNICCSNAPECSWGCD